MGAAGGHLPPFSPANAQANSVSPWLKMPRVPNPLIFNMLSCAMRLVRAATT